MRPTARPQSALRTPLNNILGTEANVRVLRVMTESSGAITAGELARRTWLQRSTVSRTLDDLGQTGIVTRSGAGAQYQVALRPAHPLAAGLVALFDAERRRVEDLLSVLRDTAMGLRPPPIAVWLVGSVAHGQDKLGDTADVVVLDSGKTLSTNVEDLREQLAQVEIRFDVTIEVRGLSPADLAALPADQRPELTAAIPLAGVPPIAFVTPASHPARAGRGRTHADLDVRALALAKVVASKLERDPTLVARARWHIAIRLRRASSGERRELREWDRILRTTSPARLRRFLVDPGERATRLRQTSPFVGLLSPAERDAALGFPR